MKNHKVIDVVAIIFCLLGFISIDYSQMGVLDIVTVILLLITLTSILLNIYIQEQIIGKTSK